MKVSYGAAVLIRAAYQGGVIPFETYSEIERRYKIATFFTAKPEEKGEKCRKSVLSFTEE